MCCKIYKGRQNRQEKSQRAGGKVEETERYLWQCQRLLLACKAFWER